MLVVAIAGGVGLVLGVGAAALRSRREARAQIDSAEARSKVTRRGGEREAQALRTQIETEARSEVLAVRSEADAELAAGEQSLAKSEARLEELAEAVNARWSEVSSRDEELNERHGEIQSRRDRVRGLRSDVKKKYADIRAILEARAGTSAEELAKVMSSRWLEEAQAEAAQQVRAIDQSASDSRWIRDARRVLEIASTRYQNHFLTERLISNIRISEPVCELLIADERRVLEGIEKVSNVTLNVADDCTSLRLEGLDGVGREIARRALSKLEKKKKAVEQVTADPEGFTEVIREQLGREIVGLGRKAFQVLDIKRADPEIVDLVGRLNWRTSYTQNQWLHAVEASFLAGIMASEMGLDVTIARRATLMHDIGKALTHEIDGSHAVIGADIARRVGEDEVIANAIGAHHLDEPMNSVYAYLVAAADAMSGARPGARREHEGGYNTRLEDLERIGRSYRSVDRCFAVHGGRELRVYVDDKKLSDLDAVELSQEIAAQVSEEMVFPGQIKVTVIRATEAVSTAN